ncbi:unnamed protein product [Meloidogyne enterolobii]|uniref:Uncharacterized protein n=1 Tax=Meloidogyne enterolobii TaxID=390850 RepID=A0ACB0XZ57_MELEN
MQPSTITMLRLLPLFLLSKRNLLLLLFGICTAIIANHLVKTQDDPDHPDTPEIVSNSLISTMGRSKRQWGCPNGCFSPCVSSQQCQRYQLATVCVLGCCCPAQPAQTTSLSTACDGDPAVAACLNGLCGQGYFCNSRNFCCRCPSGTSPGPCVNNLCPPGYACNTNNFCCSLGSGSVLGPCGPNGECPTGFQCGAGNLCYPVTGTDGGISTTGNNGRR